MRHVARAAFAAALGCLLAGCAAQGHRPSARGPAVDAHVPDFATKPYEPFSRANAIGLALAAWREFGSEVHDDPPGTNPPLPPALRPDRQPGLWEQVGLYWWLGQDPGSKESDWTGAHDASGSPLPDADIQPWSAAFISYLMRMAGAGPRFPYSATHADYINIAKEMTLGRTKGYALEAERPQDYAPRPGDLICVGRNEAVNLRYQDLPAPTFPSHCDIVTQVTPGELAVIGGNVDYSVSLKHVPTTPSGMLATPGGVSVDSRYPWFVVLKVLYDR